MIAKLVCAALYRGSGQKMPELPRNGRRGGELKSSSGGAPEPSFPLCTTRRQRFLDSSTVDIFDLVSLI